MHCGSQLLGFKDGNPKRRIETMVFEHFLLTKKLADLVVPPPLNERCGVEWCGVEWCGVSFHFSLFTFHLSL